MLLLGVLVLPVRTSVQQLGTPDSAAAASPIYVGQAESVGSVGGAVGIVNIPITWVSQPMGGGLALPLRAGLSGFDTKLSNKNVLKYRFTQ